MQRRVWTNSKAICSTGTDIIAHPQHKSGPIPLGATSQPQPPTLPVSPLSASACRKGLQTPLGAPGATATLLPAVRTQLGTGGAWVVLLCAQHPPVVHWDTDALVVLYQASSFVLDSNSLKVANAALVQPGS